MSIYQYQSGSWVEIDDLKCYRDGAWQSAELRRYNAGEWDLIWPSHYTDTKQYPLSSYIVLKGKTTPKQLDKDTLVVGTSNTASSSYVHDTLMFFPTASMAADLAGNSVLKASLKLRRMPKQYNDGETVANINVGYALSGADPSVSGNTWPRQYTLLTSPELQFLHGQTQDIEISAEAVTALLDGTADCLCLPTVPRYTYSSKGYCLLDPAATVLTVTYYH